MLNQPATATSLEAEKKKQSFWRLRPQAGDLPWFDRLLHNEFIAPEEQQARQLENLNRIVRHAVRTVPYYTRLFQKRGLERLKLQQLSDIRLLPILTRADLQEHFPRLRSTMFPPGRKLSAIRTSGSTGQPVTVLHTPASRVMFALLKQRELRWFDWRPDRTLASVRAPADLGISSRTHEIFAGEKCRHMRAWPWVGNFFKTGPFYGMSCTGPLEIHMDWLEHVQPDYLMALASKLEHLMFGYQERSVPASIQGVLSISQELTGKVRERVERTMHTAVQQNYGANEIGIIACRCPESGRYHVHAENCLVEIVDPEGRPCRPGRKGRLLVTGFRNFAMPLIRYDTGDIAEAVDGPCPCGRTLPSFGIIHGRYNSIISLPAGFWNYWIAFYGQFSEMPQELLRFIRRYQMHLYKDNTFELRLVLRPGTPEAVRSHLRDIWAGVDTSPPTLQIREVDAIPDPENGKFQTFTSDYLTSPQKQYDKAVAPGRPDRQ